MAFHQNILHLIMLAGLVYAMPLLDTEQKSIGYFVGETEKTASRWNQLIADDTIEDYRPRGERISSLIFELLDYKIQLANKIHSHIFRSVPIATLGPINSDSPGPSFAASSMRRLPPPVPAPLPRSMRLSGREPSHRTSKDTAAPAIPQVAEPSLEPEHHYSPFIHDTIANPFDGFLPDLSMHIDAMAFGAPHEEEAA